jgi:hypothetical protein
MKNNKKDLRQKNCHCHKLASDGGALIMMCERDEEPPPSATTPNPLYISKYYRNYFFGKWNTCS